MEEQPMVTREKGESTSRQSNDLSAYPRSIFLIIATEFCERFSFCGLRTILSLYLRNILLFPETKATIVYHVFIMVCYFVPVLGAVLADGCLGRFRTILYFSIIYTIGSVVMCLAATPPVGLDAVKFTMVGLALIASGTGGIKPCVAAFGGDQFRLPQQAKLLQQFFSIFYFTINFGGFAGMVLTPILRKSVTCFGDDTCYSLGFGFPALLMATSLFLFVIGKPIYRIKYPKQNVIVRFVSCATYALLSKLHTKDGEVRDHWLDYASQKFDAKLISDMKSVLAILFIFIPLPIFWSLFDQQGSRWTFQASRMNGDVWGMQLMPDQIQIINPVTILILIPVFNKLVYPSLASCNILTSPLERMVTGGFLAGAAFVCSAFLEHKLEETYPVLPTAREAHLDLINTLPCDLHLEDVAEPGRVGTIVSGGVLTVKNISSTVYEAYVSGPAQCGTESLEEEQQILLQVPVELSQVQTALLGVRSYKLTSYLSEVENLKKTLSGKTKVRIVYLRGDENKAAVSITVDGQHGMVDTYFAPELPLGVSAYMELLPGPYKLYVTYDDAAEREFEVAMTLDLGGVYNLVLREASTDIVFHKLFTMTPPNTVHMLWIAPQYILMSVAEVMFAISGLEFSFTQAPKSMKTITMAAWYFSVACGNLIVILVAQANLFYSQAHEFYLFAALIVLDMILFAWISSNYPIKTLDSDDSSVTLGEEDDTYPLLGMSSHETVLP